MSSPNTSEKSVYLDREEHLHKGKVGGKVVVPYLYDAETDTLTPQTAASGGGGIAAYSTTLGSDRKGLVDADRHVQVDVLSTVGQDPLTKYRIADIEKGVTYNYYGFTDVDGNWYIMRETATSTEYRYFAGVSAYTTGWTNRATHTYNYLYEVL